MGSETIYADTDSTVEQAAAETKGNEANVSVEAQLEAYKSIHAEDLAKMEAQSKRIIELEQANAKLAIRQSNIEQPTRTAEENIFNLFLKGRS